MVRVQCWCCVGQSLVGNRETTEIRDVGRASINDNDSFPEAPGPLIHPNNSHRARHWRVNFCSTVLHPGRRSTTYLTWQHYLMVSARVPGSVGR